ncbi:DNA-binding transcriptional regulator, GntR family [Paenibacillus sp. 1_12]|uniref:GntR family transcriptional regulator n=1 Tax=Paenibacillus sp. 1_12 TaxID=1566278 RepID=UPI0008F2F7F4|nr:GntR family transcriptional regulator [Paenibacillus sp. 1_12]SFL76628.1 DNA-binding transcriptional regulator, GntR family [Paenibacillus sp. 1_12]
MNKPLETAYAFIRSKILDGTYGPSQKLTEVQLSEEIGVSRNTVIKALLKLEQENLISIEKNKGATIKAFNLQEVINYLEIREVLEGLAIRSAVSSITEEQLGSMEQILGEMSSLLQNNKFDAYSNLNKIFHNIIYSASHNRQAVEMINMIKTQLNRFHFKTILVPGRNHESFAEHNEIYNALMSRNELAAEKVIKEHVANVRRTIQENYQYLL